MRYSSPIVRFAGAAITVMLLAACAGSPAAPDQAAPTSSSAQPQPVTPGSESKPNIVVVLTDDLSSDLVRFMPQVQRMAREGARFTDYSVTDSLCCPSRASILTGQFPHNTGIFTNSGDDGGFRQFHRRGGERSTIGTELQRAGYRTGFMGKYMNGYRPEKAVAGRRAYVPPGWNSWAVAGNGYPQYDYQLNENGRLVDYGHAPRDYLTDVLTRKGNKFIRSSVAARKPFYLQLNTFSPHTPATPAPRHKGEFAGLTAPRGLAFDERDVSDKPRWLRDQPSLTSKKRNKIDKLYRKRVRSIQSIDDMLAKLRTTLRDTGEADNTYVVFSSDNGYHMGEHRLMPGKQTAFRTDVTVPLMATGPEIPAGRAISEPAQNVDLRPTFAELARTNTPGTVDGRSLAPLLRGEKRPWRTVSLIEHHGPNNTKQDPDRQGKSRGNPPTYAAIRTPDGTYVEYTNGDRAYYDRRTDPHQLTNTYSKLSSEQQHWLHNTLDRLRRCQGSAECGAASRTG